MKSSYKSGLEAGRQSGQSQTADVQAGIWITLVGTILSISALEHFTRLPWFANYPLAIVAGLLITAGYLQLKRLLFRK